MRVNFSEPDLRLMIRALGDGEHPENVCDILTEMRRKAEDVAGTGDDAEMVLNDPVDWVDLTYRLDSADLDGNEAVHLSRITRGLDESFEMHMGIGLPEFDEGPEPE